MKTDDLSIDHVHPKSLGGGNRVINLLPSCQICQWTKGNLLWHEFEHIVETKHFPGHLAHELLRRYATHSGQFFFERHKTVAGEDRCFIGRKVDRFQRSKGGRFKNKFLAPRNGMNKWQSYKNQVKEKQTA